MQTRRDRSNSRYHFESLHEMGAWIDRTLPTWRGRSSADGPLRHDWTMGVTYKEAVRMAVEGWPEGADKAQEALKAFVPSTSAPDTKIDFYGFRPHVPRFCAGAPNNMIRHTRDADNGSGRVLTLLVPVNALARVRGDCMSNFGVAVAQYINQMEMQGTRIELICAFVSAVNSVRVSQTVTLKHADQPLDLAVVSFAIGHPAMFRRLGFALLERCDAPECYAYGSTKPALAADLINAPLGTIVLNGMNDANECAPTPEKALEYVSKQIEKAIQAQELPEC